MKSAILLSSMTVLAAGAKLTAITTDEAKASAKASAMAIKPRSAKTFPKVKGLQDVKKALREAHETAKEKGLMSTSAKEEGLIMSESHSTPERLFEVRRGYAGCDAESYIVIVEGYEADRCVDGVYVGLYGTIGSSKKVKPNNGGFPIELFYEGAGCRDKNWIDYQRVPKAEFGFPGNYRVGECVPVMDEYGNTFYQGAFWTDERMKPMMSYGMRGVDGREPGCQKGKFAEYNVMASYMCQEDGEDDEGNVEYSMLDVSSCSTGVAFMHFYSEKNCPYEAYTRSESYSTTDKCTFDMEDFSESLSEVGYGGYYYYDGDEGGLEGGVEGGLHVEGDEEGYYSDDERIHAAFEYSSVMCDDSGSIGLV